MANCKLSKRPVLPVCYQQCQSSAVAQIQLWIVSTRWEPSAVIKTSWMHYKRCHFNALLLFLCCLNWKSTCYLVSETPLRTQVGPGPNCIGSSYIATVTMRCCVIIITRKNGCDYCCSLIGGASCCCQCWVFLGQPPPPALFRCRCCKS